MIQREKDILYIACTIGKMILQNGGETYRTEETIVRICEHYHIRASSFATLNTIITSIDPFETQGASGNYTYVDRIHSRTINLEKVHRLNDLARNLDRYDLQGLKEEIRRIEGECAVPLKLKITGHVLAGISFAFLFGGNLQDAVVAVISMFFLAVLEKAFRQAKINGFFTNLAGGMLATAISLFFFRAGFVVTFSTSIIAALMLLAPGIAFTNSIRDIISGDFISGVSRGVEAMTTGIALAAGSGVVLSLFL